MTLVGWDWHSRPGTTAAEKFSILAAVEVVIAVILYWGYAIYAHTQTHLLISVIAAPLLLLRSEESVRTGMKYFGPYDDWVTTHDAKARESLDSRYIFPLAIFGLIFAFVCRLAATARHPIAGLASLSSNWWRTLFATDLYTRPEIMPGNEAGLFSFDAVYAGLTSRTFEHSGIFLRTVGISIDVLGGLFVFLTTLGPSYCYRMSIKSSAWANWPLAYISRPLRYADDPEEVRMRLWDDPREWLRRVAMVITITGALIASVPTLAAVKTAFPAGALSIIEYAVLIDIKSLLGHPWRVVALISAAITLVLTWYGFELSLLVKRSMARPDRLISAGKWAAALEYAMRVRDICGWIFWALVFVHAGLWLAPSTAWLTGYPREILQFVYGEYLPPE